MTAEQIAPQLADTFNRHGQFTARRLPFPDGSVEVRYVDSGDIAATVWPPQKIGRDVQWMWLGGQPGTGIRYLPESATVEEVVRAVATHVLDEVKR